MNDLHMPAADGNRQRFARKTARICSPLEEKPEDPVLSVPNAPEEEGPADREAAVAPRLVRVSTTIQLFPDELDVSEFDGSGESLQTGITMSDEKRAGVSGVSFD